MPRYIPYDNLKARDRSRIRNKAIYPHRTTGHGVRKYLYPVGIKTGDLLDMSRRHV